jgi:hypothetical protein
MKKEANADPVDDLPDVQTDETMRAEYDFTRGVRGRYAKELKDQGYTIRVDDADGSYTERIVPGGKVVVLEPDVWEYFPDSETVNKALRAIISILPPQPGQRKTTGKT